MNSHRIQAGRPFSLCLAILGLVATSDIARAQLHLTPLGTSRGFTPITTFASGFTFTSGNFGPVGVAYRTDGGVLVTDFQSGNNPTKIYLFPNHHDNQVASPGLIVQTYPHGNANALAQIQAGSGWKYYMVQYFANKVVEIDQDGNIVQDIVNITGPGGIAPYPPGGTVSALAGHFFVGDGASNIWDVNPHAEQALCGAPLACSMTLFKPTIGGNADGMSFSPDGSRIYIACNTDNVIRAYDTSTAALIWTSPVIPGGPDGTAIGLGTLTGYIYVNFNSGDVWELGVPGGPHAGDVNHIATGGSRGDFIAVDPNVWSGGSFPSLLLTQTDRIVRMDPPGGGWFGPPTSSTAPVGIEVGTSFCSGDGTLATPCPCSLPNTVPNPAAAPGHGCANSLNLDGALLIATGTTAPDTVKFTVFVSQTYVSFGLLLKGNADAPGGIASADGVRCTDGQLIRFGAHFAGTNGAPQGYWTYPNTVQTNPVSVQTAQSPAQSAYYQFFYRNTAANFCNAATTNWSNGIEVAWP